MLVSLVYSKITSHVSIHTHTHFTTQGIVFCTYSIAIRAQKAKGKGKGEEEGQPRTRVDQLIEWATDEGTEDFNGCVFVWCEGDGIGRGLDVPCILISIHTNTQTNK